MDREYHRNYSREYYHRKKSELIQALGGKCVRCETVENLEFDHIDPFTKEFPISDLLSHSWETVLEEVKKCQLLCCECHKKKTAEGGFLHRNRAKGADVGTAVLNEELVRKIKIARATGTTLNQLMVCFPEVKKPTLYAIISNSTWKHVEV